MRHEVAALRRGRCVSLLFGAFYTKNAALRQPFTWVTLPATEEGTCATCRGVRSRAVASPLIQKDPIHPPAVDIRPRLGRIDDRNNSKPPGINQACTRHQMQRAVASEGDREATVGGKLRGPREGAQCKAAGVAGRITTTRLGARPRQPAGAPRPTRVQQAKDSLFFHVYGRRHGRRPQQQVGSVCGCLHPGPFARAYVGPRQILAQLRKVSKRTDSVVHYRWRMPLSRAARSSKRR